MKIDKKFFLPAIIILVFAGIFIKALEVNKKVKNIKNLHFGKYERIISLAPSITEVLFTLDLGDRVVGVTRYCRYPPEALHKTKIGGYFDQNYEVIIRLHSDLVIMLPEHELAQKHLQSFGVKTLMVNHDNISGILNSILTIGNTCDVGAKALKIVKDIEDRMNRIKNKTNGLPQPQVMISVGRDVGSRCLTYVYVAGKNTFYDDMIILAGGVNVYDGKTIHFPRVSVEGIYQFNPQIIIDMIPDIPEKWNKETLLAEWNTYSILDAVKKKRVYLFEQDYSIIPGPRFILLLEQMARLIHPEVKWD